jgi:thiamine kinase-like enzyme
MTALSCELPVQVFERFTDADAMGAVWRKQLPSLLDKPFEFTACNVQYARCRIYLNPNSWHKSFLCVCYEFEAAPARDTSYNPMTYGRAYLHGRSRDEFAVLTPLNGAHLVPELDMIVWNFPDDPHLPQLRELLDVKRVARHFPYANLSLAPDAIVDIKVDVVRYRPEQRCILRYEIIYGANRDQCVLYAKVFADDNGERVIARMQHCHAAATALGVRIARPLGYSAAIRIVWQEELTGTSLTAALDAGDYEAPMAAIGHCLARLHAADLPMQKTITRDARLADARKKANKLAQMLPDLADDLDTIIACAQAELPLLPSAKQAVIHGDMHCGQFLITADGALALFDFDEWSHGDPAQDLADLIVDLHVSRLARGIVTEWNQTLSSGHSLALLAGYRRSANWRVSNEEIAWHARLQLINKAYRTTIQQEPRWREKVPLLLALAVHGIDPGENLEQELTQ